MAAGMTAEEANAIMAQFMSGVSSKNDQFPNTNTPNDRRQTMAENNSGIIREAKKLRTSSEVSISGQSDLADASTTSEDVAVRRAQVSDK